MKRHDVDVLSLVAGLFFLGVVATWALDWAGVVHHGGRWLLPGLLVVIGVAGLLSALPRRRRHDQPSDDSGNSGTEVAAERSGGEEA